jgi:hypothetical protein
VAAGKLRSAGQVTAVAPAVAAGWLRDKTGCLIEAVDPAPGADVPRVPLDTLLDDAGNGGVATGSDRSAEAGLERP